MKHSIAPFSPDPHRDFEIRTALGLAVEGSTEPGEVLAATAGIRKDDHEAWFAAWNDLATRAAAVAEEAARAGHRISAAEAALRASTYFGIAVNALSALPDSDDLVATFRKQRSAWESFVSHSSTRA